MKIEKETAKRLYPESQSWFQEQLEEAFGKDCFNKKSFDEILTFEDACEVLGINPDSVISDMDTTDEAAYKKLKVIVKAINQVWTPDWNNGDQKKWYPYFNLSSGFGFSGPGYSCDSAVASVGSRLCFETEKKADYTAKQFLELYKEFLIITK
jgi:hypothetical protein